MYFPLPAPMLEFLILAILSHQDSYGYEICQTIKQVQAIKEPVLYPILKRLESQNEISSYEKKVNGRRRKYYRLTQNGDAQLIRLMHDWSMYTVKVTDIVLGKESSNEHSKLL